MSVRTKLATLLLSWLILIPIVTIVPGQTASAAVAPERELVDLIDSRQPSTPEPAFGTRLSSARGATMARSSWLPTDPFLPEPEFSIWPNEDLNQVVNLESFVNITDGFESESWCVCLWFVTIKYDSVPVASLFEFTETKTGARDKERCLGPGLPWVPSKTSAHFPWCGHEWSHSSDVTGAVNVKARVEHIVFVTGTVNFFYPAQSRASDTKRLEVGEVQTVGQTRSIGTVPASPGTDTPEFCENWGIQALCWLRDVGEQIVQEAIDLILEEFPILQEVVNFFSGCGDAALEAAGGILDILNELKAAITDPVEFATTKVQEFKDLIAAIKEDPEKFALEVLGDLAKLDVLENEGVGAWLGEVSCMLAIEFFSGKATTTILMKARKWMKDRKDNNNTKPPCKNRQSSFPGTTEVQMADGSYTRIDSISPGDWVLSHNLDTSRWEPGLVTNQWSHLDDGPDATVEFADGSTVTATDDHRFWNETTDQWTELQYFGAGEQVLTPAGTLAVDHVTLGDADEWIVWELSVLGSNNFTVRAGTNDVLVHNAKPPCPDNIEEDLQAHAPKDKPDPVDTTNLPEYTGKEKPRNPDGTYSDGWRQAPNVEKWRKKGGKVYDSGDGGLVYETPDGVAVKYNENGYPDFTPYTVAETDITGPARFENGDPNRPADFKAANEAIGKPEWGNQAPEGYTWHHVETDGGGCCTMQLVPDSIHGTFPHTGGVSTSSNN